MADGLRLVFDGKGWPIGLLGSRLRVAEQLASGRVAVWHASVLLTRRIVQFFVLNGDLIYISGIGATMHLCCEGFFRKKAI